MTPEEIWQRKSDDEVLAALTQFEDYTPAGQLVIHREAIRRGIEYPPPVKARSAERTTAGVQRLVEQQSSSSDPKPQPGIGLMICTGIFVCAGVFLLANLSWALENQSRLSAMGVDIDPVYQFLSWLMFGMYVLVDWVKHFKETEDWKRRQ